MMNVIDTPEGIEFYQLCARRGALRMELVGMKRRGRTAYSLCKEIYGLKGTRERVLAQMTELIEQAHAKKRDEVAQLAANEAVLKRAWKISREEP